MPIFKKKSDDVLDLTDLRRRGLFKSEEVERKPSNVDSLGWVDYSKSSGTQSNEKKGWTTFESTQGYEQSQTPSQDAINQLVNSQGSQQVQETQQEDSGVNALGFLDSFAASASTPSSEQNSYFSSSNSSEGSSSSYGSSGSSSGGDSLEIQGLKNKIEDLEYKLRVLEDKISGLGG